MGVIRKDRAVHRNEALTDVVHHRAELTVDHDIPVRTAPCPLLFASNGGKFNERGLPIFNDVDEDGYSIRSLCDRAYDCGVCPLLRKWVEHEMAEGWSVGWECDDCLRESGYYERRNPEVARRITGYYQAGRSPTLVEGDRDFDPDLPSLPGCTSCNKGTSFLQLVLRKARR